MKDFDFDELDRAVSGALGTTNAPAARGVSAQNAHAAQSTPAPRVDLPLDIPERTEAAAPRQVAPRPSAGRFMDFANSPTVRPTPPQVATAPESEPVVSTPARQEVPMNDFRVLPRNEVQPVPEKPAVEEVAPEIIEEAFEEAWPIAPESPFLPDAKVEKRPLGASQPTGAADPEVVTPEVDPVQPSELELEAIELSLPAEESILDEVLEPAPDAEGAPEIIQPVAAIEEVESVPEFDIEPEAVAEVETPAYSGPVAITPQYTPKPSENQESGEIFDTESYHQPIVAKPAKKGGALKVILISLLIVVLGAAAGAGIYFYVLPML